MQDDEPHALPHALGHALDHGIVNPAMVTMPPPQQHIGAGQPFRAQAMLRLLQCRGGNGEARIVAQQIGNRLVHAIGIERRNGGTAALVNIFAPDNSTDRHPHLPRQYTDFSGTKRTAPLAALVAIAA